MRKIDLILIVVSLLAISVTPKHQVTSGFISTNETYNYISEEKVVEEATEDIPLNQKTTAAVSGLSEQLEEKQYLGNFRITHYCACKKCCGSNAKGITVSGKQVEAGKTIAVSSKQITLGSKIYIDGYGYREAQDTGSGIKQNCIDVYVESHEEALKLGVVYKDVFLVKEG